MSEQMHLLDSLEPGSTESGSTAPESTESAGSGYDHSRFLLDAQTRRIGLAGLAKARAALAAAVREHDHLHEAAA